MTQGRFDIPEEETPFEEVGWLPLGEAVSSDDMQLAAVILYELGIECHWAGGLSEVADLRRVLEPDTGGQILMVLPQNADRAKAAVKSRLTLRHIWSDVESYLHGRPTEDVLRIFEFRKSWSESVLEAAKKVLKSRGVECPHQGVSSHKLPFWCFVTGMWFGPLAILMRAKIEKRSPDESGEMRLYYDEDTRKKAHTFLIWGMLFWLLIILMGVARSLTAL